jgi:hypothetical protein
VDAGRPPGGGALGHTTGDLRVNRYCAARFRTGRRGQRLSGPAIEELIP